MESLLYWHLGSSFREISSSEKSFFCTTMTKTNNVFDFKNLRIYVNTTTNVQLMALYGYTA